MRKVKTHTFNGKKYHIYIHPLKGVTTPPDGTRELEIFIRTDKISKRMFLDTCIHEALHASKWSLSEKDVNRMATEIAKFLWRLGYRR